MALPAAADFIGSSITEAQFKTAIVALRDYVEAFEAISPGQLAYFKRTAAPDGFIKANGAAVLRSAYSALDAAIYCGDTNNATAESCYRCTNQASPNTSRSTTGAYLVLPDERGEYPRGWDDARGVDMSRSLWAHQADQNKAHAHTIGGGAHSHVLATKGNGTAGGSNIANTDNESPAANLNTNSSASHSHTVTNEGGTEARPRNNAWLACIKY